MAGVRVTAKKRLQSTTTGRLAGSVKRGGSGRNKLKKVKGGTFHFKSSLTPSHIRGAGWASDTFHKFRTHRRGATKVVRRASRTRTRAKRMSFGK